MCQLISELRNYMMSSELSRLSYRPDAARSFFSLVVDGMTVFENDYVADGAGVITIHNLDDIICDYIYNGQPEFSFYADGDLLGKTSVLECRVNLGGDAQDFFTKRFLTMLSIPRYTTPNRYELLSAFNQDDNILSVEAVYLSPIGEKIIRSYSSISPILTDGHIETFNLSPVLFKRPEVGELVCYTAVMGERRQTYTVSLFDEPFDPAFVFRNSFGCLETIFFPGEKTTDSQFTRSASTFDGKYLTYNVEEVMQMTASTGLMAAGSELLARDLARSMAVFLLNDDGSTGSAVTITDCSVKSTNSDELLPSFTFTYRYAADHEIQVNYVPHYRIFDLTFDLTYE